MATPITGQVQITASAQPLSASSVDCTAFSAKAAVTNAHPVYVGPAAVTVNNGFRLDPGDSISVERSSQHGRPVYQVGPADFSAIGTAGDVVSWLAFP
jgi:hypothetical protein